MESVFEEIMPENNPNLKKKTYIQGIGSTEGPKQDKPKQTHTKICHNYNGSN